VPRRNASVRFLLTIPIHLVAMCTMGCGGGLPLLHSVHVLPPGRVSAGAGLSGQVIVQGSSNSVDPAQTSYEGLVQANTIFPAMAPWVSARVGLPGSNEAGLTYSGRSVRLDGRHSFQLNKKNSLALSTGLGGELLLAGRPRGGPNDLESLLGGGFDLPILFGWRSTAGLYSAWIGPRPGISWVRGSTGDTTSLTPEAPAISVSARDVRIGFVGGLSVGFRQVHVALELGGAYHVVDATIKDNTGSIPLALNRFTLTPAGALILTF
jgi:hypothetical protein